MRVFARAYRVIDKEEAVRIIEVCASVGMFHMVFLHYLIGGAMNEYVICNCCTDGCVPHILNRALGQEIYPEATPEQDKASGYKKRLMRAKILAWQRSHMENT